MSSVIYKGTTVPDALENLVFTPFQSPELIPSILPLVVGALVIELYFGKHSDEELGWNTSVGNAVIWATTGVNLLMTAEMNGTETMAAFSLVAIGGLIGYMDFFHKWPDTVAFLVSSSGVVYSLAYIIVVMVKTSMPINATTMKAGAIFFVAVNIGFKVIQGFETSSSSGIYS